MIQCSHIYKYSALKFSIKLAVNKKIVFLSPIMTKKETDPDLEHEPNDQSGRFEHYRFVADPGQGPMRVDKFIQERMVNVSRNRIQNALKQQAVLVNGQPVKANYKVRPNDVITIEHPDPPYEPRPLVGENIPLDVRYEDEYLMILHKPAGMVVHPGVGQYSGTLVNALVHYFNTHQLPVKEGNANDRPGLVHRIDKNTSGLMVVAKTPESMTHLSKQFFDHSIERSYWALVWGEPSEVEGTITGHIGRHPTNRLQYFVYKEGEEGKHAVTHYKTLEPLYYVSLMECRLETGRTHQIRVHMKSIGHPVFNDDRYGGNRILKGTVYTKYRRFVENCFDLMPRQALHARSLGFVHPATGEKMYFEADLPDDFRQVLDRWRNYLSSRKIN